MNTKIKEMRAKLLRFVESSGGQADLTEMRQHVGIAQYNYSELFQRAVKTKKLIPVYGDGHIGSGFFLSRKPVIGYRLA